MHNSVSHVLARTAFALLLALGLAACADTATAPDRQEAESPRATVVASSDSADAYDNRNILLDNTWSGNEVLDFGYSTSFQIKVVGGIFESNNGSSGLVLKACDNANPNLCTATHTFAVPANVSWSSRYDPFLYEEFYGRYLHVVSGGGYAGTVYIRAFPV